MGPMKEVTALRLKKVVSCMNGKTHTMGESMPAV